MSKFVLAVLLMAVSFPVQAQQTGKVVRIGLLDPSDARSSVVRLEPFWQEIRRLGWIEGKNLAIEYRFAEEKSDRQPELASGGPRPS
jgi:putative tryptophan/tyrosine transport system substrate-binding protein